MEATRARARRAARSKTRGRAPIPTAYLQSSTERYTTSCSAPRSPSATLLRAAHFAADIEVRRQTELQHARRVERRGVDELHRAHAHAELGGPGIREHERDAAAEEQLRLDVRAFEPGAAVPDLLALVHEVRAHVRAQGSLGEREGRPHVTE